MKTQDDLLKEMVGKKYPWGSPPKMPFTKIEGFLEEFPWVRFYVGGPIAQVYVYRLEAELITRPLQIVERNNRREIFKEKIFLLGRSPYLVTATGTETVRRKKFWLFGPDIHKTRMVRFDGVVSKGNIRDALSIIGDKNQFVRLVLSYWEYTQAVIIYKLPKDVWLAKWMKEQIEAERASFKKSLDEI